MDPTQTSTLVSAPPMRPAGPGCGQLLLPTGPGVGGEPLLPAIVGRGIYPPSLLWRAQNDGLAAHAAPCGGSQAGAAPAAGHGFDGRLSQAPFELQPIGPQAISLFAEELGHRATQSSLEHRHHLHSAAGRVCLSGGGHRLVQPLRAGLGVVDQFGSRLLRGRAGAGVGHSVPGDLQHRPGGAIHQRAVSGAALGGPGAAEYGRTGAGLRQHLRGAVVAHGEVRGGLPQGLPRCAGSASRSGRLLSFLQRPMHPSSVGLSHAAGSAFWLPPMKRSNEPSTAGGRELRLKARPPASLAPIIAPGTDSNSHHLKATNNCLDIGEHLSFSETNVTSNFACYSFQPRTNLPVKVIVLDDTMSDQDFAIGEQGCLDPKRFNWLVKELDRGQAHDQLMIIAAHVPLELIDTNSTAGTNTIIPLTNLLATLHTYPNLLLWMCGHTHQNNIIPQPSPYPDRPEYGFWEVQTASLRDFPQEFRAWEILRNTDNSISIRVTDIDPEETTNSPATVSRGYAVGAARIFMTPCTSLTDTNSYAHNAELLKLLTPSMQTKIANYGGPLGHHVAIDRTADGVTINFLGELQSADTLAGPWNDVTSVSPYSVSAAVTAKFYRASE